MYALLCNQNIYKKGRERMLSPLLLLLKLTRQGQPLRLSLQSA
jgi:hypothetical protein